MNANTAYAELISLDWNAPDVTFPPVRRPTNASGDTTTSLGDCPTPDVPSTCDSSSDGEVIERSQVDEVFDSGLQEPVSPSTGHDVTEDLIPVGTCTPPARAYTDATLQPSGSYSPRSPVWSPNFPPTDTDPSGPANMPPLTLAGAPTTGAQPAHSAYTPRPLPWAPNYAPVNTGSSEAATTSTSTVAGTSTSAQPPWRTIPFTQKTMTDMTNEPGLYEQFDEHWTADQQRIRQRQMYCGTDPYQASANYCPFPSRAFQINTPPVLPPAPIPIPQAPIPIPRAPVPVPRAPNPGPSFARPDIPGRNAALTTISNILFNFDILPDEAADLLEDACATAQSVGVSTHKLLAQTVTLGNEDLGVTPLRLEASRWVLGGETDLVAWLIENSPVDVVERDLKRGCLARCNGMGEQLALSTLKLFVPERPDQAVFAYDVVVERVGFVPDGARLIQAKEEIEDDEDEGSLYDDVSFIDQADIETLKSSEDEPVPAPIAVEPPLGRIHRARLDVPLFKEALTFEEEHVAPAYTALPSWRPTSSKLMGEIPRGVAFVQHMPMKNRVLTAEWMFEGRLWALAMGEEKLVLTLRQTSDQVSARPIKVKAMIRIFPVDVQWDGFEELTTLGPDQLLPTHEPTDILLIPPSYTCEFDEKEMVPGPPSLKGRSSLSRDGIHMSSLSLLEMVGLSGAMKVEVTIKTTEIPEIPEPQPSTSGKEKEKASDDEKDKNEWQLVD